MSSLRRSCRNLSFKIGSSINSKFLVRSWTYLHSCLYSLIIQNFVKVMPFPAKMKILLKLTLQNHRLCQL